MVAPRANQGDAAVSRTSRQAGAYRGRFAPSPSGWLHLGMVPLALAAGIGAAAIGYLALQAWDWWWLDFTPQTNAYGSLFYVLSGALALLTLVGLDAHSHRRTLPAGQNEAVQVLHLTREPNLNGLGTDRAQSAQMRVKAALNGEEYALDKTCDSEGDCTISIRP